MYVILLIEFKKRTNYGVAAKEMFVDHEGGRERGNAGGWQCLQTITHKMENYVQITTIQIKNIFITQRPTVYLW